MSRKVELVLSGRITFKFKQDKNQQFYGVTSADVVVHGRMPFDYKSKLGLSYRQISDIEKSYAYSCWGSSAAEVREEMDQWTANWIAFFAGLEHMDPITFTYDNPFTVRV